MFDAFFDALAAKSQTAHLVQMFASTTVRAHVSAAGAQRGQDGQAIGRSRGGLSIEIHLKVDHEGLPLAFHLTEGQAGDSLQFEVLLDLRPEISTRTAVWATVAALSPQKQPSELVSGAPRLGGTGRSAWLRFQHRKAWRFKSLRPHRANVAKRVNARDAPKYACQGSSPADRNISQLTELRTPSRPGTLFL